MVWVRENALLLDFIALWLGTHCAMFFLLQTDDDAPRLEKG